MKKQTFRSIIIGLIFIGIAVYIVLDVLDITMGIGLGSVLLTLLAAVVIIKSIRPLNFWGIFFPLALVGILYDSELGIEKFTVWPILGVALFLSIGFEILFKRKNGFVNYHHGYKYNKKMEENNKESFVDAENFESNPNQFSKKKSDDDSVWKMEMGLGKKITYITSQNLKEASFECGLGELQIYFTEAKMQGESIVVHAEVGLGRAVLYFPTAWNVITVSEEVFGRVNEQAHTVEEGAPIVYLNLEIGLGEVEINYI